MSEHTLWWMRAWSSVKPSKCC